MANLSEDIQCAGSDTRPPMLDKTDFASWQQRIRLYCRGKENGVNILKSIDEGPFQMGTTRVIVAEGTEGSLNLGPERPRVYSDLSQDEKDRYNADIRATNIILQGLPKDIYSLINHYTDAKDIWDNVKMLLEGSELTKEDRESQLYDDFEHFRQNKGETIHDYYVRFAKLINDMRNIKMTMSKIQLNSKFVNNMLPEWGRFVTAVKLNKGLKDSNFDQLYAYLKQHEAHANENKMMLERLTQQTVDPLALMSNVSPQHYHSQSSTIPPTTYHQPHSADTSQSDWTLLQLTGQPNREPNQHTCLTHPGRQNRGQGNNARGAGAVGYGGAQNRVGNANPGQARQSWMKEQYCSYHGVDKDNAIDEDVDGVNYHTAWIIEENFLATLTPTENKLSPEKQIFWSQDIVKMKAEALKELEHQTYQSVDCTTFSNLRQTCKKRNHTNWDTVGEEMGFEQTKTMLPHRRSFLFSNILQELLRAFKSSNNRVKEISDCLYDELEAELDQSIVDRKHDEIERKNLLIEHDNIIADGLSKEVFFMLHRFCA
ncbi:hypothetical protein Tco_1554393 [Tanacetum coccineum]